MLEKFESNEVTEADERSPRNISMGMYSQMKWNPSVLGARNKFNERVTSQILKTNDFINIFDLEKDNGSKRKNTACFGKILDE